MMPTNNWIPVAQNFTQFLDQQTDRKRKLMQRGMMQVLPSYVSQQLSGITSKEDLYKKLPELSAQMFAIDPEIGATATQLAQSYGNMKLNQIQEKETEDTAAKNIESMKDTFGNVKVFHKGQTKLFGEVMNEMGPMRNEDKVKFGEQILKAGQVQTTQLMNIDEKTRKKTMTIHEFGPGGEPTNNKPITYNISSDKTLDNPLTKEVEKVMMDLGGEEQYSKFLMNEYERDQSVRKSKELARYQHGLSMSDKLAIRDPANVVLESGEIISGTQGYIQSKDKEGRTIYEKRFFDRKGNDISETVMSNKVYGLSVKQQLGLFNEKDFYSKASHSAGYILNQLNTTNVLDDKRLEKILGTENYKQYGMGKSLRDLNIDEVDKLLNLYRTSKDFEKELLGAKNLDKPDNELSAGEKEEKSKITDMLSEFWTNYNNALKSGQNKTIKGSQFLNPSGVPNPTTKQPLVTW